MVFKLSTAPNVQSICILKRAFKAFNYWKFFDPLLMSRYNTWKRRLFQPTNLENPFWSILQRFQLPNKSSLPRKSTLLLSSLTDVPNTGIGERIVFLEFQSLFNGSIIIFLIEIFFSCAVCNYVLISLLTKWHYSIQRSIFQLL